VTTSIDTLVRPPRADQVFLRVGRNDTVNAAHITCVRAECVQQGRGKRRPETWTIKIVAHGDVVAAVGEGEGVDERWALDRSDALVTILATGEPGTYRYNSLTTWFERLT